MRPSVDDHQAPATDAAWIRAVYLGGVAGYAVLFLLSPLLLSVAGGRVPVYLLMACLGVLPALSRRRAWAITAVVLVLFAAAMGYIDYEKGKARFRTLPQHPSQAQPTTIQETDRRGGHPDL